MMRKIPILIFFILCLISCNDTKKENDPDAHPEQNMDQNRGQNQEKNLIDNSPDTASNKAKEEPKAKTFEDFAGTYINTEHADDNCMCYCLEVTNSSSELCLKENELYINARFEKQDDNINVYYSGKSSRTSNSDIPWEKFEKGTPIAVLMANNDGTYKLDWKGFTIDGDIAVDYALLGKKTLEGNYKKK